LIDILDKIEQKFGEFSKGQKLIAEYIKKDYDKAAFMTAAVLGEIVGVSESTVVRFACELGYDGYPRLQKALREIIKNKLTSAQRLEVSSKRIDEDNLINTIFRSDIEKLKITLDEIDRVSFGKVVDKIMNANRIYIIAVRSAAPLASFMGHYFNLIFDNVKVVHTTDEGEMFEQIVRVSENDVIIGISFPRYSKRTIKALEFSRRQGATTIAFTDSLDSPLAEAAELTLTARSDMASFADSLVAPLSMINALIVAVGMRRKEKLHETFIKLETIWEEYHVYETKDRKVE
jgi:DNA-binding MurR/RpiR family transcriptional regulator